MRCRRCRLWEGTQGTVFGEGDPHARLMIVGEGPGQREDEQGRPFVGRAGQLLDQVLEAQGLSRQSVYITNVVKHRPPQNRTPLPDEVATCLPILRWQFYFIRPKVILLLGLSAVHALLDPQATMGRVRGQLVERSGVWMLPTYHPAAVLRNPGLRVHLEDDVALARKKLEELAAQQ
ncbi:MAG: uracil-DNA glycosylase [Firmicutes bacterium]|nr:uracil-DNA glycosylase [Bacillota bacterium]